MFTGVNKKKQNRKDERAVLCVLILQAGLKREGMKCLFRISYH